MAMRQSVLDAPGGVADPKRTRAAGPVAIVAIAAVATLAIHLLTNGQYGYHRDELYYLASGQHPAFGYVDYPPLTPLLARLDAMLLGDSTWALRLLPSLVGAGLVVLTAVLARELGGARNAQALAAVAAASSLLLLGANWLFQTVTFDMFWWIAALLLFTRLIRTSDSRLWIPIGIVLGLGLETKFTIIGLGIGLAAGVLLTPTRGQLRTRWPWLGVGIATILWLPNLVWEQLNGWPTLEFVRTHGSVIQAASQSLSLNFDSGGVFAFMAFQPLLIGFVTLPVWLAGWYYLLRPPAYRAVGIAALVPFVLFGATGKAYYPGPLIPLVLAAGCVWLERAAIQRGRRHAMQFATGAMLVQAVIALPLVVPLVPQAELAHFGLDAFRKDFADTVGWPELVDQVTTAYQSLDPSERQTATILAGNYGEAGAIALYGPARGLPAPISPHLTFWYWKPAELRPTTVISVGIPESTMRRYFQDVMVVGQIQPVDGVRSEEVGRAILVCRDPLVPLDAAWAELRSFR
jgi:hypothetical protein